MLHIPKKKEIIVETETNPLETNSVDLSYDEQYTQAIMKAVASESGAIVEYEQILALEPNVSKESLVNLFHDTLVDIKNEEITEYIYGFLATVRYPGNFIFEILENENE